MTSDELSTQLLALLAVLEEARDEPDALQRASLYVRLYERVRGDVLPGLAELRRQSVHELREAGWTTTDLAVALGVAQPTIARMGKRSVHTDT